MRSILLALVLTLSTAAAHNAWAAPAPPLNKREARALSPDALKRRVLQQLGDVLVEAPRPTGAKPRMPLTDLWYRTLPHATAFKDVCASESITVTFDHGNRRDADAETPAQVVGLQSRSSFRVAPDGRAPRCDGLKPYGEQFIFAEDARHARTAVRILARLQAESALRDAVDCNGPCPAALKTLTPDDLYSVSDVATPSGRPPGEETLVLDLTDLGLTVTYVETADVLTIRKVWASQTVMTGDARID